MKKAIGKRALIITLVAALLCIAVAMGIVILRESRLSGEQNCLRYLNIGDTWHHYRGDGVTVAVIDTGIDTDHPEFAGRISEYSYNATYDKIVKDYMAADSGDFIIGCFSMILLSKYLINIKILIFRHIEKLQKSRRKISNIWRKALTRDL